MLRSITHFVILIPLLFISACHFNVKIEQETENVISDNPAVVFVQAYNSHDENKMLSMVHEDIKYMYVDGANIYTETNDKNELAQFLAKFFQQKPDAQSAVISSHQNNRFIHQVEKALWKDQKGKEQAQCSLSVYELKDNLIFNVWYHQAYPCAVKNNIKD